VKNGSPLYTSILNKWSGAIPAFKKKPKINKKSQSTIKTECTVPGAILEATIIAFNSKYIDVFQTKRETIKNRIRSTVLKNEIQNCVNNEVISRAGAGLTVSERYSPDAFFLDPRYVKEENNNTTKTPNTSNTKKKL